MFFIHITPEKFKNATIIKYCYGLALCLSKTRAGEYYNYRNVIVFKKRRFQNVFRPTVKRKTSVFKFVQSEDFNGLV